MNDVWVAVCERCGQCRQFGNAEAKEKWDMCHVCEPGISPPTTTNYLDRLRDVRESACVG